MYFAHLQHITKHHHFRKGMTLIEILIVVVLIASMMTLAMIGLGIVGRTDVQGSALKFSSMIRYTFNMAATTNQTLQLKLDFDNSTFTIERLDVFGGLSDEALRGDTLKSVQSGSLNKKGSRASRLDEEDSRFGTVSRTPVEDILLSEDNTKLDDEVFFVGLMTSHHDEMQTDGIGTINFFANGFVEKSIIYLGDESARDGADDGIYYSIIVNPLTGQSSVIPGKQEISSTFFEEEED